MGFIQEAHSFMCSCITHMQIHHRRTYMHARAHAHTLTHTLWDPCCSYPKTLTTLFTHLRSNVACYHDNPSSHNSLYWLRRSFIFSTLSQRNSNDMLVFQPPRTTALVDYQPPNENMRQEYIGECRETERGREREKRERFVIRRLLVWIPKQQGKSDRLGIGSYEMTQFILRQRGKLMVSSEQCAVRKASS